MNIIIYLFCFKGVFPKYLGALLEPFLASSGDRHQAADKKSLEFHFSWLADDTRSSTERWLNGRTKIRQASFYIMCEIWKEGTTYIGQMNWTIWKEQRKRALDARREHPPLRNQILAQLCACTSACMSDTVEDACRLESCAGCEASDVCFEHRKMLNSKGLSWERTVYNIFKTALFTPLIFSNHTIKQLTSKLF